MFANEVAMMLEALQLEKLIEPSVSLDALSHRCDDLALSDAVVADHGGKQPLQTCCAKLASILAKKHPQNLNTFCIEFLIPPGKRFRATGKRLERGQELLYLRHGNIERLKAGLQEVYVIELVCHDVDSVGGTNKQISNIEQVHARR